MPDLSIVIASRNDNYGGEVYRDGYEPAIPTPQKDRMRLSMMTLHEAFKDIDYEVIMIEWNPPSDKERFSEWDFMRHQRMRIIEVPNEFSRQTIGDLGFHEFYAKNIGIRRAHGNMILCTNPDVLWIHKMSSKILSHYPMRAWRWSVFHQALECRTIKEIQDYCLNSTNCIDHDINSNGDFTLLSKECWFRLCGYTTIVDKIAGIDMRMIARAAELEMQLYELPFPIYHIRHTGRKLDGAYNIISVREDFGFPEIIFREYGFNK